MIIGSPLVAHCDLADRRRSLVGWAGIGDGRSAGCLFDVPTAAATDVLASILTPARCGQAASATTGLEGMNRSALSDLLRADTYDMPECHHYSVPCRRRI